MSSRPGPGHARLVAPAVACVVLLLAACGGGGETETTASEAPTTVSAPPATVATTVSPQNVPTTIDSQSTTLGRSPVSTTALPATAGLTVTRALVPEATASYEFQQSSINGTQYSNVLRITTGSSSRTLEINAGRSRKRLLGDLGIPDDQKSASSVQVDISLDNGPAVFSTTVNFGETKPIDLDVTNVLRVRITVLSKTNPSTDCCPVVGIGNPRFT